MALNPLDLRWQMVRDRWPIRIKNSTGAVIPPFSLVLGSTPTSSNNEIVIPVIQPNAASTDFNWDNYYVTGPFQIGLNANAEGLGTTLATPNFLRYDTGTPAKGDIYGPKHSQLTASKNYYGFEALGYNTTASGQNVMLARWIGTGAVIGTIDDTNVTTGNTCTVSVYVGSTYQTDSTMNITGVVNRGPSLTSVNGKYCGVSQGNGIPVLMWVAC